VFTAAQAQTAQANLLVGPTSLEFVAPDGASQPPAQTVSVISDGPALSFQTHTLITGTSANWLSISQIWGSTPATLSVTVDATGLQNGVYRGYISITSGQSATALVAVTLKVGVPASAAIRSSFSPLTENLRAFPKGLTFTAHTGTGAPAPQSIAVPRSDREDGITAKSSAAWLSVLPATLDSSGKFQEMQVGADPDGLASGQYSASVVLRSASGVERTVPVTFNVGEEAHLVAEPSVLGIRAQANGTQPSLRTITIGSTGNRTLHYTATTSSGSWLAVGPQTGSTDGSNTISVALNPANLPIGTHTGSITVTAPGAMESLVVPVSFTVTAQAAGLAASPDQFVLNGSLGGPVQTQMVSLTSTITAETFTVASSSIPAWLTVTPNTGTVPATLTFSADPNVAGFGTVHAQPFITGTNSDEADFMVTFVVGAGTASSISASPASLTFAYTVGGSLPPAQTVQLNSSTSNSFTAGSDAAFISVSPSSGTSPTSLSVALSSPVGSQRNGVVTVSGGLTSGSTPLQIPYTVNVTNPTPSCTTSVSRLNFSQSLGQAAPPAQTFQLMCNTTASFTATTAQSFDSVTPTTGTVTPSSAVTITVSVSPTGLMSGTNFDNIGINLSNSIPAIAVEVVYTIASANTITATPTTLSFTQVAGGAAPPTQSVSLTAGSPTTFSASSNVNFLSLNMSSGTTPATLIVTENAVGLGAGTYQGIIAITGGQAEVDIVVTLTVTTSATTSTIIATPSSIAFSQVSGGSLPSAQTIQLTTSPSSPTAFAVAGIPNWLTVTPTTGTTDQLLTLSVNSNSASLPTGVTTVPLSITGGASTLMVNVSITITSASAGAITATPSTLSFTAVNGGSAPSSQTVTLTSSPSTSFAAASNQSWLLVSPNSGTTGTSGATLTVSVVTSGMGVGTYNGKVTVSNTVGTVSIPVTLTITSMAVAQTITASPASLSFVEILTGSVPASQTVQLTAPSATTFTAAGTQSWLTVSPSSGNTPATLTVSVNGTGLAANTYTDTITVTGGSSPVTIAVTLIVIAGSQFDITPSPRAFAVTHNLGDTAFIVKQVQLSAPSAVTFSVTVDQSWLTVSPLTGTTPATLTLTANTTGLPGGLNTANITVSGGATPLTIPVMVTIAVAPNAISATPSSVSFSQFIGGTAPGSQMVQLTSANPTAFTASYSQPWLTVTPLSGTTNATLTLSVNPNTLTAGTYNDTITITGGATPITIPVSYALNADTFLPSPASLAFVQTLGGSEPAAQTVQLTSGISHTYIATTSASWISVSPNQGTSPATLSISVSGAGMGAGTYNGSVTVNGDGPALVIPVTLTIATASGAVFSPTSVSFTVAASTTTPTTQMVNVTSGAAQFSFTATATVSNGGSGTGNWLSVSPTTSNTPATLTITASPAGLASGQYAGIITITPTDSTIPTQNLPVTLTVTGTSSTAFVRSVLSAASFLPGPVSPGELISLFGLGLGPATGVNATALASGAIDTELSGTQVFFDGVAAPILYAQAGQINVIVPYNVYGRTSTSMQVSISSILATPVSLAVQNTAPAVFSAAGTGTGEAAVINQNGTINGPNFPAPALSVIAVYGTGEGQTSPAGQDGRIISTDLRHPLASSSATIGGVTAPIQYVGSAPGLVSGVFQMNIVVPSGLTPGQQPLVITIGGMMTQVGATVAVQ